MSPRGVAIPEIRERLFRAGEGVLMSGGPGAISARSVTREAGVASGVLYNHFEDLDDFLAELVIDRFRVQADEAAGLPQLAGTRTVAENLTDAACWLLESPTLAVADLVRARLGLTHRVTKALADGAPGLREVETSIAAYLEAERRLGRVSAEVDVEAAGLMLVGAVHHLLLLYGSDLANPAGEARRVATAIAAGFEASAD
jgi:AcrR family transcriptional regulator